MRDSSKDETLVLGGVFELGDEFTVSFIAKDE